MKYRKFAGKDISILGFGAMRLPMDGAKINEKEAVKIIHAAIDNGVNYVDSAYYYHEQQSESLVGRALAGGYRNKTYIATKSPMWSLESKEDFERLLDIQLKRMQTDCVDFYMFHGIGKAAWEKKILRLGLLEEMERVKKAGKIAHIGFSFHDHYSALTEILDGYGGWDFCQLQVNYIDTDGQAGLRGWHYAESRNVPAVIMEPLWGGKLANPPKSVRDIFEEAAPGRSPVEWALDWLWAKPAPHAMIALSGMSTLEQVLQNCEYAGRAPDEIDQDAVQRAQKAFKEKKLIPCTGCSYCGCPHGVAISSNFDYYNEAHIYERDENARSAYENMVKWMGAKSQAKNCVSCGSCEELCPQHIKIGEEMPKVAEFFSSV